MKCYKCQNVIIAKLLAESVNETKSTWYIESESQDTTVPEPAPKTINRSISPLLNMDLSTKSSERNVQVTKLQSKPLNHPLLEVESFMLLLFCVEK